MVLYVKVLSKNLEQFFLDFILLISDALQFFSPYIDQNGSHCVHYLMKDAQFLVQYKVAKMTKWSHVLVACHFQLLWIIIMLYLPLTYSCLDFDC
jgi:hypothetical protein